MRTIYLPERMSLYTIDVVLQGAVDNDLNPLDDSITYDLSRLTFIDASGVTVFSNLIEWLLVKKVKQKFIYPSVMSEPIKFLDDSLFFERYLGKKINSSSKPRDTTIPLKLVMHSASHWWIEQNCIDWLSRRLKISAKALVELKTCLQELFNNIKDHSGVETGCIFVQHYPKRNQIVVSMSDFGKGIPSNVKKIKPELSDGDCVLHAVIEGFTTNSTNRNRGIGLSYLVKTVARNKGHVSIRSGGAHVLCDETGCKNFSKEGSYYAGTLFEITLRTDQFDTSLADEEDFEW